jgi:hypothetical protein
MALVLVPVIVAAAATSFGFVAQPPVRPRFFLRERHRDDLRRCAEIGATQSLYSR